MGITTSWKRILIDTSVIIRVINHRKNKKEENKFANQIVEYLSNTEAQVTDKKTTQRSLFVSAISIAEIIDSAQAENGNKTKMIVEALNAKNLEIIDFDEDVAEIYNLQFIEKLGVDYQKNALSRWGVDYTKVNREILTKDLMILGCGLYREVDAVLCMDKGMYKIGRECGINMVYTDPKYFNYNETYVFEFYTIVCDEGLIKY